MEEKNFLAKTGFQKKFFADWAVQNIILCHTR